MTQISVFEWERGVAVIGYMYTKKNGKGFFFLFFREKALSRVVQVNAIYITACRKHLPYQRRNKARW